MVRKAVLTPQRDQDGRVCGAMVQARHTVRDCATRHPTVRAFPVGDTCIRTPYVKSSKSYLRGQPVCALMQPIDSGTASTTTQHRSPASTDASAPPHRGRSSAMCSCRRRHGCRRGLRAILRGVVRLARNHLNLDPTVSRHATGAQPHSSGRVSLLPTAPPPASGVCVCVYYGSTGRGTRTGHAVCVARRSAHHQAPQ
eukprot:5026401-Prymnesium_polylepis.1